METLVDSVEVERLTNRRRSLKITVYPSDNLAMATIPVEKKSIGGIF